MRVIDETQRRFGLALVVALVAGCYQGVDEDQAGAEGAEGADGADGGADGASDDDDDDSDDDDDDDDASAECQEAAPGASPIRRMTAWEYDNTVRDLLGDDTQPSQTAGFPQEGGSGFDNNADVTTVTWLMANKYMLAAEDVSERAVQDLNGLMPCALVGDEEGCMSLFVTDFGQRAWRRPLTPEEIEGLTNLYLEARTDNDLADSVAVVVQALLQSPHFLYRVELGVGEEMGDGAVELSSWEMASRLSYFLWGSMPDPTLFDAAAAGELTTKAQVEAQARRLLDDPRARAMVSHFSEQWLGVHSLSQLDKDPELFPEWSQEMAIHQLHQTQAFVEHVMFEDDATLETMLTADYTFIDGELASFYDMTPPELPGMQKVTPTGQMVSGVLTHGGILAEYANPNGTNPIARGIFVREHLLCQIPPPPPDDVDINPPQPDPNATTREQYEQHRSDPACSGCHVLFDPVGFGFENYDAVGRWRNLENGQPVDATGELAGADNGGEFDGVIELGQMLAESKDVADCVTRQWFRFANGRTESADHDACNLEYLSTAFEDSGYDLRELLVSMTQADAFMYRTAYAAEGGE